MRLLVAGGGTGGHLYPGVAIAESWLALGSDRAVAFAGTKLGIEARVVPELGHRFFAVRSSAVAGGGPIAKLRAVFRVLLGVVDAGTVLREFDPHVVLGVGGYASVPVVLRSALARRATAIQEQNAEPGLANRTLGRFARRVFVSFQSTVGLFPSGRAVFTGNPIRATVLTRLEVTRRARDARASSTKPCVFVLGGSQGSRFLNETMPGAIARVVAARRALGDGAGAPRVIHQTGVADESLVRERYRSLGLEAEVSAYIHDMGGAYGAADLLVSRAGAGALSELAAVGLPAILVPYPHAGAHQETNARAYATSGAAVCLLEREASEERLAGEIETLLADPSARARMSAAALAAGRPGAADEIARSCAELAASSLGPARAATRVGG